MQIKEGRLYLKDELGNVVKKITISHPNHKKVEKEKEKLRKHFNMQRFYIDASEFHLLPYDEE